MIRLQCLTVIKSENVFPLRDCFVHYTLTGAVSSDQQWLFSQDLCRKSWQIALTGVDVIRVTSFVTRTSRAAVQNSPRSQPAHRCLRSKINKQVHSCLSLGLFVKTFLFFLQLVSVTATASVSTRACARSARTWRPAGTARAASPASTEIRPTGAAASVSIRRRPARH